MRGAYRPVKVGHEFGPEWSTHWVRVAVQFPPAWRGQEVHLLWDLCSEACVRQDGVPMQGLTGTGGPTWMPQAPTRPHYRLHTRARGGERLTLPIEVACNHLFGSEGFQTGKLRQAEIATFDREAWELLWDYAIVADMAQHLPVDTPRAGQASGRPTRWSISAT